MAIELGQVAYTAYVAGRGDSRFRPWEDQSPENREAWRACADGLKMFLEASANSGPRPGRTRPAREVTAIPAILEFLSDAIARHVLWHFQQAGGIEPGSFTVSLMDTISRADPRNFQLLTHVYPGYTMAIGWAKDRADGIGILQALIAADPDDRAEHR